MKQLFSFLILFCSFITTTGMSAVLPGGCLPKNPAFDDIHVVLDSIDAALQDPAFYETFFQQAQVYINGRQDALEQLLPELSSEQKGAYRGLMQQPEIFLLSINKMLTLIQDKTYNSMQELMSHPEIIAINDSFECDFDVEIALALDEQIASIVLQNNCDATTCTCIVLDTFLDVWFAQLQERKSTKLHEAVLRFIAMFKNEYMNLIDEASKSNCCAFPPIMVLLWKVQESLEKTGVVIKLTQEEADSLRNYLNCWLQHQLKKPMFQELCGVCLEYVSQMKAILH